MSFQRLVRIRLTVPTAPFQMRKRGVETKLIIGDAPTGQDETLIRNIAKAHYWFAQIKSGKKYNSRMSKQKELTEVELDRVIEMAWEDRTPFEAILYQFKLTEKDVIKVMRGTLKESSFKRWRKRVNSGVSQKHLKKRNPDISRFKCSRQKSISGNKISKR